MRAAKPGTLPGESATFLAAVSLPAGRTGHALPRWAQAAVLAFAVGCGRAGAPTVSADADAPATPTKGNFCQLLAGAECTPLVACCPGTDAASCEAAHAEQCETQLHSNPAATFDADAATACLADVNGSHRDCQALTARESAVGLISQDCGEVWRGNVPPHGDCTSTSDCEEIAGSWTVCAPRASGGDYCAAVPIIPAGGNCALTTAVCDIGLSCVDASSPHCAPLAGLGESCSNNAYGVVCDEGLVCGPAGQCVALKADGVSCASDAECLGGCRGGACTHDSVCAGA